MVPEQNRENRDIKTALRQYSKSIVPAQKLAPRVLAFMWVLAPTPATAGNTKKRISYVSGFC